MLLSAFVGFVLCSFVLALFLLRPKKSEKVIARRLQIIAVSSNKGADDDDPALPEKAPAGPVSRLGEYLQRFHFSSDLEQLILHAGSKASVGSVIVGSIVTAAGAGLMAHIVVGVLPLDLAAVAAGGASRYALLRFQRSKRTNKFSIALPDAIELMARALRAGHSMSSSIEIVAEQSAEPLASEFAIVFQQQKFGIPFRDAILQLGDRVPSKDLHFLITAILVQKETGGDLTEILDRTTDVIRDRVRIEGEIRTHTAQGRLTGWILSGLPLIMLGVISIINPGYSHVLFSDPIGQKLLYGGSTMILLGGFIISRIVNIQV